MKKKLLQLNYLIILISLFWISCSEKNETNESNSGERKKKEKPTDNPVEGEEPGESDITEKNNFNYRIIPSKSFGDILPNTSEEDLKKIFGAENVVRDSISLGEGMYSPGTVVFKGSPNEISIIWKDENIYKLPYSITFSGENSEWYTEEGIKIGSTLEYIQKLNGGTFTLTGFGWDYAGTIIDWNNGKLKHYGGGEEKINVLIRLGEPENNKLTDREYESLLGDKPILSENKLMYKMNPKAYQIIFIF